MKLATTEFEFLKLILQNQQYIFLILDRMNQKRLIPDKTIDEAIKLQINNFKDWQKEQDALDELNEKGETK